MHLYTILISATKILKPIYIFMRAKIKVTFSKNLIGKTKEVNKE